MQRKTKGNLHFSFTGSRFAVEGGVCCCAGGVVVDMISFMISNEEKESP